MLKELLLLLLVINIAQAKDVIQKSDYCSINWSTGVILCQGESAAGQKKFRAKRAAVIVARRNLLELIKGVRIDSETTVENGILKSDVIKSSVSGVVKGCEIVSNQYNRKDKSSLATVKILIGKDLRKALLTDTTELSWNEKIKNIFNIFLPTQLNASEIYTNEDKGTLQKLLKDYQPDYKYTKHYFEDLISKIDKNKMTGLLIDAREIPDFEPAMNVKLVDKHGKEIYPGNYVSQKQFIGKNGVSVGLDFDIKEAMQNKRVFDTPLKMKVSSVYKKRKSDIILSDSEIEKLHIIQASLKHAKVIVVVAD